MIHRAKFGSKSSSGRWKLHINATDCILKCIILTLAKLSGAWDRWQTSDAPVGVRLAAEQKEITTHSSASCPASIASGKNCIRNEVKSFQLVQVQYD